MISALLAARPPLVAMDGFSRGGGGGGGKRDCLAPCLARSHSPRRVVIATEPAEIKWQGQERGEEIFQYLFILFFFYSGRDTDDGE